MKNNLKSNKNQNTNMTGIIINFDQDVLEKLRKDTKYKKIKMNTYVNKVLREALFDKKLKRKSDFPNKIMACPECFYEGKMTFPKNNSRKRKRIEEKESSIIRFFRRLVKPFF